MSGPAIAVRQAIAADARAIAEVYVEGWRWAYRGVLSDELLDGLSVERREAMWRDALAPPDAEARIWLAERDGRVIGFVATAPARGDESSLLTAEVTAIHVARHAAGTGAGRELLLCATGDLRRRGFRYAQLWVFAANARRPA
jgi:ribosomal protein S18 acetylase RimI-like enzyme